MVELEEGGDGGFRVLAAVLGGRGLCRPEQGADLSVGCEQADQGLEGLLGVGDVEPAGLGLAAEVALEQRPGGLAPAGRQDAPQFGAAGGRGGDRGAVDGDRPGAQQQAQQVVAEAG